MRKYKLLLLFVASLLSEQSFSESTNEHILKNRARSYCRQNPEQCTPTYLMQKFPGTSISSGNGNCVNISFQNTIGADNSRNIDVQNQLIMDDLTVICD